MDKFDDDDFFDDCSVCQFTKANQKLGRTPTMEKIKTVFRKARKQGAFVKGSLLEETDSGDERKWMEERGFEYIGTADDFKMPEWMDCVWRRVPCGKDACKMCGKIKQDRLRHIMKGEDPDDLKSVFKDAGNSLGGALAMIKQHAAEMEIDITNINEAELEEPPEPDTFPLYQKAAKWHDEVAAMIKDADFHGDVWLLTEAAADLGWYKNTLLAKIYRQLCNCWRLDRGDEYGEIDSTYTKYVLRECVKVLKQSLAKLSELNSPQKGGLMVALTRLVDLEKQILEI